MRIYNRIRCRDPDCPYARGPAHYHSYDGPAFICAAHGIVPGEWCLGCREAGFGWVKFAFIRHAEEKRQARIKEINRKFERARWERDIKALRFAAAILAREDFTKQSYKLVRCADALADSHLKENNDV